MDPFVNVMFSIGFIGFSRKNRRGASWEPPGASWERLGASCERFVASWGALGASLERLGTFRSVLERLGSILGVSWSILEPLWMERLGGSRERHGSVADSQKSFKTFVLQAFPKR